ERDRRRRDALVHDRDAVVARDRVSDRDEVLRMVNDLRVDLLARALGVRIGAVEQADAERGGSDVERLELDHAHRFEDLLVGEGHEAIVPCSASAAREVLADAEKRRTNVIALEEIRKPRLARTNG